MSRASLGVLAPHSCVALWSVVSAWLWSQSCDSSRITASWDLYLWTWVLIPHFRLTYPTHLMREQVKSTVYTKTMLPAFEPRVFWCKAALGLCGYVTLAEQPTMLGSLFHLLLQAWLPWALKRRCRNSERVKGLWAKKNSPRWSKSWKWTASLSVRRLCPPMKSFFSGSLLALFSMKMELSCFPGIPSGSEC